MQRSFCYKNVLGSLKRQKSHEKNEPEVCMQTEIKFNLLSILHLSINKLNNFYKTQKETYDNWHYRCFLRMAL